MAKDIRECLLEQARKFHQWQEITCLLYTSLTNTGKNLFPELLDKFLAFYDRKGKTSLETMLKRWYTQLEKEYRNHIEG